MRFGILGTGAVGQALGSKLLSLGHEVMMGSRKVGNPVAVTWASTAGSSRAGQGSFADAAHFGEMVINATAGIGSLDALAAAGEANLAGKILIDVANPIKPDSGSPPTFFACNDDSLGERIQRQYSSVHVVKALNTVTADLMVNPHLIKGLHHVFVCGNDMEAKNAVEQLLVSFGWPDDAIIDLGDISSARGTEMYLALWLRMWATMGSGNFNIAIRAE